jgi:hypothetical protein
LQVACKRKKNPPIEDNTKDTLTVVAADTSLPDTHFVNDSLYYYEDIVEIKGKIDLSDKSVDDAKIYIFSPEFPVKILSHKENQDVEDPNVPVSSIDRIHLLFPDPVERVYLTDKPVIVKGVFWGAYSGSHLTPVIMDVISIRYATPLN